MDTINTNITKNWIKALEYAIILIEAWGNSNSADILFAVDYIA